MPHSGGGGSHSGGSHSSSHSGGGGSHSGGGRGRSYRHSDTPFTGSHPFVVYSRTRRPRIVYSDNPHYSEEMTKGQYIISTIFGLWFTIPGLVFFLIGLCMFFSSFSIGYQKTNIPGSVEQSITILDENGYLSAEETEALEQSLTDFRDHTGIIPAIELTEDSTWQQDYTTMESFAYNEYICHFDDEYHLLVVYGYGDKNPQTGFHEFHYETMWGNDLSKTASKKDENKLIDLLQKQFARANGEGVGGAAADAFNEYLEYFEAKSFSVDGGRVMNSAFMLIFGLPFLGAGLLVVIFAHKRYQKAKKEGVKTYRINGTPEILTCDYCGCTYYAGTVGLCPHCGAPLKASSEKA